MARRVPERIDVYNPETNYTAKPDDVIPYDEARARVERGEADFVKHGKAIRMRRNPSSLRCGSVECNQDFIAKFARAPRLQGDIELQRADA